MTHRRQIQKQIIKIFITLNTHHMLPHLKAHISQYYTEETNFADAILVILKVTQKTKTMGHVLTVLQFGPR